MKSRLSPSIASRRSLSYASGISLALRLLLSNLIPKPGTLLLILRYIASSGCTRITSSFVASSRSVPIFLLYKLPGTCLNCTLISALKKKYYHIKCLIL
ncbi:hypothetical protein HanPSC8_Chr17g0795911 [Helianthus annuus]|nr:hypothetical protein HanPSC8_Chr17g0795911 [Helianthus annuus]